MTERRQGHSKLVWDKDAQALKTVDPNPPARIACSKCHGGAEIWWNYCAMCGWHIASGVKFSAGTCSGGEG